MTHDDDDNNNTKNNISNKNTGGCTRPSKTSSENSADNFEEKLKNKSAEALGLVA